MEEKLKNKKELTEEELKLLRGVLQPPFKDRKDPDYFTRMRKARGLGNTSDDSDGKDGVDDSSLEAMRRRNKVVPQG